MDEGNLPGPKLYQYVDVATKCDSIEYALLAWNPDGTTVIVQRWSGPPTDEDIARSVHEWNMKRV